MTTPTRVRSVLLTLLASATVSVAGPVLTPGGATAAPAAAAVTVGCHRTRAVYPVLEPGDRGPAVRTLQCLLRDLGVGPVEVDGWYGPQTRAAVARVEATFEGGRSRPGEIDAGFWVLLFGRQLPEPLPSYGDHGRDVRTLQRALRAAGCSITVDGDYGDQTRKAVRAYRQQVGSVGFFLAMGATLPR